MAAGMSIFTMMGNILIDNDKANQSLHKTEQKSLGVAGKLGKMGTAAVKAGAVLGAAAVAGGTALFGMAKKAADTTDRVDKLSQKIGISRKSFQEYEYILSQNGADVEKLQVGMKTLTQRMSEASEQTGIGAEAFTKLGLSAKDLNGNMKSQEVMFEEAAKALMAMPEGAEKSQLAFELFGKAGLELMPMLNGSAESFDELKQAANDMGLVLSDEAIAAGVKFTDTMDNAKRTMGAVVANIGVEVMPMFQTFLNWILAHMPEIQHTIKIVFKAVGKFVNEAVNIFNIYLLPAFKGIFQWVSNNWSTISAIIKASFFVIKTVWNTVLKPVLGFLWQGIKTVVDFVSAHFPSMEKTFKTVFDGIGKAVSFVADIFKGLTSGIKTAYEWLTKWNDKEVKNKKPITGKVQGFNGSHYNGIENVPFNNYSALLHKGERVLTAKQNKEYSNGNSTITHTGTIRVEGVNSKGELVGIVDLIAKQISSDDRRLPNRASVIPI